MLHKGLQLNNHLPEPLTTPVSNKSNYVMGKFLGMRVPFASLCVLAALSHPAKADDSSIPAKCRVKDAQYTPKCSDIIDARFHARNAQMSKRDKVANAELENTILATKTRSGETIKDVLSFTAEHIPLALRWSFVYARSGTEYVVLDCPNKPGPKQSSEEVLESNSLYDYDLATDPLDSMQNSAAVGALVWKVDGKSAIPWGRYANMLMLGSPAFTWSLNNSRKGFSDSGYSEAVERDTSFVHATDTGSGKLSDYVSDNAPGFDMYWNVVAGYVVQTDTGQCPAKQGGVFLVQGKDCGAKAAAVVDYSGRVLPFSVIRAVRNSHYVNHMVEAFTSLSVAGGGPGDWMATAAYVAEHSLVGGATFSQVELYVPNPWGDMPPTRTKKLAVAYYAPDPEYAPWKEKWGIYSATRAATLSDIEYDQLSNHLIDDPAKTPDPEIRLKKADDAARKIVAQKYSLSKDWAPSMDLGTDGQDHDREHIHITSTDGIQASMAELTACLTKPDDNTPFQGCMPSGK